MLELMDTIINALIAMALTLTLNNHINLQDWESASMAFSISWLLGKYK